MSNNAISNALEVRLAELQPPMQVVHENEAFTPTEGVPFLSAFYMFASPDDWGSADSDFIQRGIMQIGLHYPKNVGRADAQLKAEEIRRHFARGSSYTADDVMTVVDRTPEITGGRMEDEHWTIRVRVRFYAQIKTVRSVP